MRKYKIYKWYQHIYQKITTLQSFSRIILAKNQIVELKKYKKSLAGAKESMIKLEQEKLKLEKDKILLEKEKNNLNTTNHLLKQENDYLDTENKSLVQEKIALSTINSQLVNDNKNLTYKYEEINKKTDSLKNEIDILNIQQNTQRKTKIKLMEEFNKMNQEILEENERLRRMLHQEKNNNVLFHKINIIDFNKNKNSIILMSTNNVTWKEDLKKKFDLDLFNDKFEEETETEDQNALQIAQNRLNKLNLEKEILPHQEPFENILAESKNIFFELIEKIPERIDPLPSILKNDRRKLATAVLLIIFGTFLLIFATLFRNSSINIK